MIIQFGYGYNPTFPISFNKVFCALACVTVNDYYAIIVYNKTINRLSMFEWQTAYGGNFTYPAYWIAIGS